MFHDVQFPTRISYGSRGGPGFNTNIIETDSGAEQRIQRWDQPRHMYDVAWGVKSLADLIEVRNFYIARNGCAYAFRYNDPLDHNSASGVGSYSNTDQVIGVGDGSTTEFQLVKKYVQGPGTVTRTITKPITVVIAFNGINQTSGWLFDNSTGIVTFSSAPSIGVLITAGFDFDVPVRFGKEIDQQLTQSIDGFDSGEIQSIPLVEVMDTTQVDDGVPYGGSYSITTGADLTLNLSKGRTQLITASNTGRSIMLPNPATIPLGGPICCIINAGSNTFTLKTHTGSTLVSMAANKLAFVWLGVDGSSAKIWIAA